MTKPDQKIKRIRRTAIDSLYNQRIQEMNDKGYRLEDVTVEEGDTFLIFEGENEDNGSDN